MEGGEGTRRLTVAIIGRPNVGKSTLFNRLVGRRLAIVDDTPGVTRDWRSADARVGGLDLTVIDTAGLEDVTGESLEAHMRRQTEAAVARADVGLFVVDARAGITPVDRHFAQLLRKGRTPIILVANKCEGRGGQSGLLEAFELGLGDPVPVSAEHGEGLADLVESLLPWLPPNDTADPEPETAAEEGTEDGADDEAPKKRTLYLAIVGRPNVGKSTLLNALLGEERVIASPEAGTTRDAITVPWSYRDQPIQLVDTAGLRRKARIDQKLEKLAVADTLRVIRLANVVILVLEPDGILDKQDLTIADLVLSEGRGLVIALNKWDAADDRAAALQQMRDRLEASLPQARGVPTVTLSALKGQGLDKLLDAALEVNRLWNRRVPTGPLNRWLEGALAAHPPPLVEGRRVKVRYATQVKARPPTFALFVNRPTELPDHYTRYLVNSIRDTFDMPGVPIRLLLRSASRENPYAED